MTQDTTQCRQSAAQSAKICISKPTNKYYDKGTLKIGTLEGKCVRLGFGRTGWQVIPKIINCDATSAQVYKMKGEVDLPRGTVSHRVQGSQKMRRRNIQL